MARMPAIVVPGVPLHVTHLGAAREPLFFDPRDYATYLLDLGEAAAVYGCAVHAYVLLPDHARLLLTPAEADGPWRLMQALRRRHDRQSHRGGLGAMAGRGRPGDPALRVAPIHSDREVLARSRRIELDPVRAGIVSEPIAYRWSSFRANGLGARDAVLTPHPAYLALGATRAERRLAYRALFEERPDAEVERLIRRGPTQAPENAGSHGRPAATGAPEASP